jgi:hypothetical protein
MPNSTLGNAERHSVAAWAVKINILKAGPEEKDKTFFVSGKGCRHLKKSSDFRLQFRRQNFATCCL